MSSIGHETDSSMRRSPKLWQLLPTDCKPLELYLAVDLSVTFMSRMPSRPPTATLSYPKLFHRSLVARLEHRCSLGPQGSITPKPAKPSPICLKLNRGEALLRLSAAVCRISGLEVYGCRDYIGFWDPRLSHFGGSSQGFGCLDL